MTPIIHIVTEEKGPRLLYILDVIFKRHLGLEYTVISSNFDLPTDALIIYYTSKKIKGNGIHIYKHRIISEENYYPQDISVMDKEGRPYFFQSFDFKGDYHFDLFAMAFYLLSRYEEYLRFIPDHHGRFSSNQSLAFRNNFLSSPLVDLWILDLKSKMENKWNIQIPLPRKFEIIPTFDIDTPYAYLHRPFYVQIAAFARDFFLFRIKRQKTRLATLLGVKKDIFDTYQKIFEKLNDSGRSAIFFFLMQCHLPNDQNFSVKSRAFNDLIKNISSKYKIGIHPSLKSQKSNAVWQKEFNQLNEWAAYKINISRQHFLHLSFPNTYQHLITSGISQDHSMAYHDQSGFRASTAVPYNWYDLQNEKTTELIIHPSVIMDASLRHYQKMSPEKAIIQVKQLKTKVEEVNGIFSFIWHNSSFAEIYGWDGWEDVLDECLR